MAIYFVPNKPSSGEEGQYNRRPAMFVFRERPARWFWAFSAGWTSTTFPPIRMLVDGQPVTDWVQPATNSYEFVFDVPNGCHLASFEGAPVEQLPKPFVMNDSGEQIPDTHAWTGVVRFERSGAGLHLVRANAYARVEYPGALPRPKILPLKPRKAEPYREVLRANKLWVRHPLPHTHAGMMRRWMRVNDGSPNGALWIEPAQNYFHSEAVNKGPNPPPFALRDGPRGVAAVGWLTEALISPVDAGWYWCEIGGRIGFTFHDGRTITIAGRRLKEGELQASAAHIREPITSANREFYNRPWEMVGDWSRASLPHHFYEPWGMAAIGRGPTDGNHEFWVADTLNGKIRYVDHYTAHSPASYHKAQYAPPGYTPPDAPTGQSTIVDYEVGLNQPWGIDRVLIDGEWWLYFTEFGGNAIWRRPLDGSRPKELVLRSVLHPTDAELGVPTWPPYRLHGTNISAAVLRAKFVIDGPPGVASCVRPQALKFDSLGRPTWYEAYTSVVRRLDHDGIVRTVGYPRRGTAAAAMNIDKEGTIGPVDDIFVRAWWQADTRMSTDGVIRGQIVDGIVSQQLLDGPADWVRLPGYAWVIGIGHGRLLLQGNAGANQVGEYTKRLPTDPVIDVNRVKGFDNTWFRANTPLEMLLGPNGQGELGFPHIEELAAITVDDQKAFFRSFGVPEEELDNGLYYVWASTVNHDREADPPLPGVTLLEPAAVSAEVIDADDQ